MAFSDFYYDVILGIKRPEMYFKATSSVFTNTSIHHKHQIPQIHNLAWYFRAIVKFSLVPGFHALLTSGDLINILICILIIGMDRMFQYKHFKGYIVFLWRILPKIQWFMFPLPLNFGSNRVPKGVVYDVIFSLIARLPKVYPNVFDVPHGILQ
jgi:hypothetical protein